MTGIPAGQGKVSIVIPCYNHGAVLLEALASAHDVCNASVLEVIIVDDGSSDAETAEILNEVAEAPFASCVSRTEVGLAWLGTPASAWPKANSFCRWTATIVFEIFT